MRNLKSGDAYTSKYGGWLFILYVSGDKVSFLYTDVAGEMRYGRISQDAKTLEFMNSYWKKIEVGLDD